MSPLAWRLFIALPVTEETRRWLAGLLEGLRRTGADCKWADPRAIHWTLHFFGDTPEPRLPAVQELMDRAAASTEPFIWRPGGVGAFPSPESPRILWVGLRQGAAEMAALAGRLKEAVSAAGFPVESRPFQPHLTVGRSRSPRSLEGLKEFFGRPVLDGPESRAGSLILYKSELRPRGAVHTPLHESKLGR